MCIRDSVWKIFCTDSELENVKQAYPVITTIPSDNGWEVQIVSDRLKGFSGQALDPNLEHAYVYFMRYQLEEALNEKGR